MVELLITVALNLTPAEKSNLKLCAAQREGIFRRYAKATTKTAREICEGIMQDNELIRDDYSFDECYEYLQFCSERSR